MISFLIRIKKRRNYYGDLRKISSISSSDIVSLLLPLPKLRKAIPVATPCEAIVNKDTALGSRRSFLLEPVCRYCS